ncbi:MAG TPA: transglutaminase family protein [Mycobacteriales bacterium]|nr:transglutaminase family protein [Mycobacteriales bacterium]
MSWRVQVVHTTGYRYSSPVTLSFNEVRLTPRGDARQNLVVNRIETTPSTRSYRYVDYWDTVVTTFDLHAPHTELVVVSNSIVETADPVEPDRAGRWKDLHSARVTDRYVELLEPTGYVPRDAELVTQAKALVRRREPADAVVAVCDWVHEQMTYQPGATAVHTSAVEAWRERKGVCQDFAHLSLALLRAVGVPCRYVSGYLHPKPAAGIGEVVVGESHAWLEAWTGGWWGYDPTNNIPVGERHVWVASGRDYADVPPLKGIFSGGKSSALDVRVEVTRLA